jgi:Zn-dependent peptidase ImmA (M78 family)
LSASDHIASLLEQYPDARTPKDAARLAARARLARARECGYAGPPFDPHVLASVLDIKTRAQALAPGLEAMIIPDQSGAFTIIWDPAQPKKRTNFSVAHEIAHTLFPGCASGPQYRSTSPEAELEVLCDIAAAELLMPLEEFQDDVRRLGTSLESVNRLSARYQASHEAVAIRMVYVTDMPAAVLVAGMPASGAALTLQYAHANPGYQRTQPFRQLYPGVLVPRYSVTQKAIRSPLRVTYKRDREVWYVGGRRHDFEMETMAISSRQGSPPRVLALLKPCL